MTPSDPLYDQASTRMVKRPSRVVLSAASTTTVPAGTNRHHVQDTNAMRTQLFLRIVLLRWYSRVSIKQNHVSTEARRGSVSASDNCCHHFDRNFTVISWPPTFLSMRYNTSHMIMVQMLLHSVGTHPVEEKYLTIDAVC